MGATPADTLKRTDRWLRDGKLREAREALGGLRRRRLARDVRATVAALLCRAGEPQHGVRLLHPLVRPEGRRRKEEATPTERAVYAHCLSLVGAVDEALAIFDEVGSRGGARVDFYRAVALVARWDYEAAVAPWQRYVRAKGVGEYERLVGALNLSAAFVATGRQRESLALLREVLHDTSTRRLWRLHANALELSAQSCIANHRDTDAEEFLRRAERLVTDESVDARWVQKWRAVLALKAAPDDAAARARMEAVRRDARASGDWETVRDCDRREAIARGDEALFARVYVGTPYRSFREAMRAELPAGRSAPTEYRLGDGTAFLLDVETGGGGLKEGQALHRLAAALCLDLYRPARIAALFGQLFPGEHFNPFSGPPRVHETIRRLREWLATERLPLAVTLEHGAFRLATLAGGAVRIPAESPLSRLSLSTVERLRERWPRGAFSAREAAAHLVAPLRSVQRELTLAVEAGSLRRQGATSSLTYFFELA